MIEPIGSRPSNPWDAYPIDNTPIKPINSKDETDSAEEQVASFYYLSSIQSLQASAVTSTGSQNSNVAGVESKKTEQTIFQRFSSWLLGIFGAGKTKETTSTDVQPHTDALNNTSSAVPRSPRLDPPEPISNEKLSKAIAELNKELLYRMKDTAEFEEEMLKSNSKKMDRLILFHIVAKSLDQKKLKETASLEAHENVLELQNRNKELHKKFYLILDEINATAKTNSILHWVNIGTTGGIVGLLAVGFATGGTGALLGIGLPALNIVKGGLSTAEGVLKYKNDLRTGEIIMVNHNVKENRNQITDKVSTTLPFADEDISNLLKTIRHHLENYSKEARFAPQGN